MSIARTDRARRQRCLMLPVSRGPSCVSGEGCGRARPSRIDDAPGDRARDEPGAEVRGHGVEAAARHDARAVGRRARVVPIDQPPHPRRLAGDVDIVRAVRDAGVDQRVAVQRERPRGAQHDARVGGERAERVGVARVGHDDARVRRARAAGLAHALEALGRAARERPSQPARRVRGEVLDGLPADEAGRAVEHDVVRARVRRAAARCPGGGAGRAHPRPRDIAPPIRRTSHFGVAREASVAARFSAPGTRIVSPRMQAS